MKEENKEVVGYLSGMVKTLEVITEFHQEIKFPCPDLSHEGDYREEENDTRKKIDLISKTGIFVMRIRNAPKLRRRSEALYLKGHGVFL